MPTLTFDEIKARVAEHQRAEAVRNAPKAAARRCVYERASLSPRPARPRLTGQHARSGRWEVGSRRPPMPRRERSTPEAWAG